MSLNEIKSQYINKQISKPDFIDKMNDSHKSLFDYASYLKGSDISKITIEDDKLIMTSRNTSYHEGGISFYCDPLDKRTAPIETFNFGRYEPEESAMIYKIIEPDYCVFDIGGNIGWHANHIAPLLNSGKIYTFEPIPQTYNKLLENVKLNGFKNIVVENFAFSNKIDRIKFFYSDTMSAAASAANITENAEMQELECVTNTVDNYVSTNNIKNIDFIKCDVEGAELFVYQGAKETLSKYTPIVFTEMLRKWSGKFGYHPNEILNFFNEIGYSCWVTLNGKLVPFGTVDEGTTETNFFLFHNEKHKDKIASLT